MHVAAEQSRTDGVRAGERRSARPGDGRDVSHAALLAALADAERTANLVAMTTAIARSRRGLTADDAEDVFQDAVVTYLRIQQRYPAHINRFGLLVGIFHRRMLEFASRSQRRRRGLERFVRRLASERDRRVPGRDADGAADSRIVREETARAIRASISSLPDGIRPILLALAEGRRRRLDLVRELGISRNTFDSRLHVAREALRRRAVAAGAM